MVAVADTYCHTHYSAVYFLSDTPCVISFFLRGILGNHTMWSKYSWWQNIFFGFLGLVIIELVLKAYFIIPSPFPKMTVLLENTKKKLTRSYKTPPIVPQWDRDLNYHLLKNNPYIADYFTYALIKDPFSIRTNEDSFRYPPQETMKQLSAITGRKVICLGDSWTMGWGVDYPESYPAQLQDMLREKLPQRGYEVVNMGVISYSSFQGAVLTKKIERYLKPGDVVVLSYSANDPRGAYSLSMLGVDILLGDKEFNALIFHPERGITMVKLSMIPVKILIRFVRDRFFPQYFWEYTARGSFNDCYENYRSMIQRIRAKKAYPIILYHGLLQEQDYVSKALYAVARRTQTPLINANTIFKDLLCQARSLAEKEYPYLQKNTLCGDALFDGKGSTVRVLFRLLPFADIQKLDLAPEDIRKVEAVILTTTSGRDIVEESFAMNDRGEDGDEHAGDGVWERAVMIDPSQCLLKFAPYYKEGVYTQAYDSYLYFIFKLTDSRGREYKEVRWPAIARISELVENTILVNIHRSIIIGNSAPVSSDTLSFRDLFKYRWHYFDAVITPVYSFGRKRFRSEFLHPAKQGYRLFAERVFDVIQKLP
jgi:lysophospholipase L1-like esterase